MKLDFPNMQEEAFPHFKGGEGITYGRMYFDGMNRIMRGRLPVGASIGLHTHETSSEIVYILSGLARIQTDGEWEVYGPGECHYCPKGHSHTTVSIGDEDLQIVAVVPEQ